MSIYSVNIFSVGLPVIKKANFFDFEGEIGGNVFFPFDINLAINPDLEIKLCNLENEVFLLERSIMDFQQAGPSRQNVGEPIW